MLLGHFWALLGAFSFVALVALGRATSLVGYPFPGFLPSANGTVSVFGSDDWPGVRAGLAPWDLILGVEGRPVRSSGEILEMVRAEPPGTGFRYELLRGGERLEVVVPSRIFGFRDLVTEPLPWIVTGIFVGAAGLFLFAVRPGPETAGLATFTTLLGIGLFRLDLFGGAGASLVQFVLPLMAAALFHLALVFPRRSAIVARNPALVAVPYVISVTLGAARAVFLFRDVGVWTFLDQICFLWAGVACVVLLASMTWAAARSPHVADRERARLVLLGLVPAVVASTAGFIMRLATGSSDAAVALALFGVWLWVGSLAYAAVKRDLFGLEAVVRRGLGHAVTWGATLALYGALVMAGSFALEAAGYSTRAQLPVLGVWLAIPFLPGFFDGVTSRVERWLFPVRGHLLDVMRELSEELSRQTDGNEACRRVETALCERVGFSNVTIFRGDPPNGIDVGPLLGKLRRGETVSAFDGPGHRAVPEPMRAKGFTLLLPLVERSGMQGVLALGDPPGGGLFSSEEIDALSVLASRLANSLANAAAWERVRTLEAELREENLALREELDLDAGFPELVGRSPTMAEVFRMIEQVAPLETTVLLLGETGTGKGLVARAIHARSPRRDGPLVRVSCAAIPSELVESELFGHERGAFTGAVARRHGRFELARRGTIVLDEVGELPLEAQAKLLRVLQERELERVGGTETIRTDARVIAATNRDLETEVRAGRFREDLYFRLSVFPLRLPPLRERREDLPPLVEIFLQRANARFGKNVTQLAAQGWLEIERYRWPGNVRELENVIERAVIAATGGSAAIPRLVSPAGDVFPSRPEDFRPLADAVREAKIAAIDRALTAAGTQARAAELLGLSPPSLSRMLRDLGFRR